MVLAAVLDPPVGVDVLDAATVASWSDAQLLAGQAGIAAERRLLDARAAVLAAEIARRSSRELGYAGLAVREGARSPQELVQRLTGGTGREARAMIEVGTLLNAADAPDQPPGSSTRPWLAAVTAAVTRGELGLEAARAIQAGLGEPSQTVGVDALAAVAERMVDTARLVGADRLATLARQERDALDTAGIAERERARHERRFLKLIPQWDGMTRITGLLDPESAALVTDAFDRVTAPRLGGPRFVDPTEHARAEAIIADPRETGQLLHDAFVQMIDIATKANPATIFGTRPVAVRVHVALTDLERRNGAGRIEGQPDAISIATVERHTCNAGIIPIAFDTDGRILNVGRAQRSFTPRQRIGLAARDGGCIFGDCTRPPSWCEAHHIDEWARDHGRTDIADGVLLCRFHHMLVHNQGWRIVRENTTYLAIPPPRPNGTTPDAIPLQTRNPIRRA